MAYYTYKRVCYELVPDDWRQQWEAKFKELNDREPDGDPGYNGDYWIMAGDFIEEQKAQLDAAKAVVADKAFVLERYAEQKDELAELREKLAEVEADRDSPVPASWWCTPAERKVLEVMAALSEQELLNLISDDYYNPEYCQPIGQAELDRRKAEGTP